MTRNITKEFAHFLKEEKIYSNFMSNVRKTEVIYPYSYTYNYFNWTNSPQGYEYWHKVFSDFFLKIQKEYLNNSKNYS